MVARTQFSLIFFFDISLIGTDSGFDIVNQKIERVMVQKRVEVGDQKVESRTEVHEED